MKVENIFTISIVKDSVKNWWKHKDKMLSLINDLPFVESEGYYSDFYVNMEKQSTSYSQELFEILSPTMEKFGEIVNRPFTVSNLWAQRYIKGGASHQCHNHGALGYSAVFYASLGKNDMGTKFICPFNDSFRGEIISHIPKVKEGDIIFFPSFLLHQSTLTTDDVERVIFSFNLKA